MNEEINTPSSTDSSEGDVASEESVEEVKSSLGEDSEELTPEELKAIEEAKIEVAKEELDYFKKISGREFKNKEEFEKHYQGLKGLAFKKASEVKPEEVPSELKPKSDTAILEEKLDLLRKNPEAEPYVEDLKALAKLSGKSLTQVYSETFKDLVEAKSAQDKAKEEETTPGIPSKGSPAPAISGEVEEIKKQLSEARSGKGKWATKDVDKLEQELVKKVLGDKI